MPSRSAIAVRTGIMMTVASTRGTTSRRIGEIAIARRASTCSVTFIDAELRRDARADAAADHEGRQHGAELADERERHDAADEASSRRRPRASSAVCSASTMPVKSAVIAGDRDGLDAELVHLARGARTE